MGYEIVMPQLSDSMEEGKLISWKVKKGDSVNIGDVIADVESDKAIMEVQSFKKGTLQTLTLSEGESAPIGTVIAVIDIQDDQISSKKTTQAKVQPQHEEQKEASKTPTLMGEEREIGKLPPIEKLPWSEGNSLLQINRSDASPKAKALAAHYGIDIEAAQKNGKLPKLVHVEDIEAYSQRHYFTAKALKLIDNYHLEYRDFERGKKHNEADILDYIQDHEIPLPEPLSSNQKAIITTVTEAIKRPAYHLFDKIDARQLKAVESKTLTLTVLLLKLLGEAMMRHEIFRKRLGKNALQLWPNASISVAMAYGEKLYMPVFKDLNQKRVEVIAKEMAAFKAAIKTNTLSTQQMQGSTFGLSNLGMTGIERFDALINTNDCASAAIGSEIEGKIAITLTIDHRIINGYQAAEFMQTIKRLARDPLFFKTGDTQ